jgi:hypothetical protein
MTLAISMLKNILHAKMQTHDTCQRNEIDFEIPKAKRLMSLKVH